MSLINPAILWGLGLVSIPILLHLLLRTKPKKYLFPALRLVRARRQNNIRRFRLKYLWLMLLRMAVLALLVAAIARPTLPAANYSPSTSEWLTAAGIVAVAIAVYSWVIRGWKRSRMPNHVYNYRRTLLRSLTGLATFVAFLLAVALPYGHRIAGEISTPLPSVAQNLPMAAVFVFDTSLSMSYRQQNLTRLEAAQKIATEHLGRAPTGSRVAVTDTSSDAPLVFQAEQSGAIDRISKLQTKAVSLPLADRLRAALALQEDDIRRTLAEQGSAPESQRRDRYLREVYLFTDLTVSEWHGGDFAALQAELKRLSTIQLYIIDVGIEKVTNAAIIGPRLSSQSIAKGSDLVVEATVDAVGFEGEPERTLELHVQNDRGQLIKREQRTVKPLPGKPAAVSFQVNGLSRPITHGELRLASSDPYAVDDVRYFTVAVTPPMEVLVVGESHNETRLLEQMLAPSVLVGLGKARYNVKYVPASKVGLDDLAGKDLVCLVNVRAPSESIWSGLDEFVRAGGGLLVVAGSERLNLASYDSNAAQAFLPARLRGDVRLPDPVTLDLRGFDHPVLKKFGTYDGGFGDLATSRIYQRWGVQPAKGTGVIAAYTDAVPAILERSHGDGRTIMMTTGITTGSTDRKRWSDLPFSGWQFLALVDQIAKYLSRRSDVTYNYIAGDEVAIPLPSHSGLHSYLLRKPGGEQLPGDIAAPGTQIVLHSDDQLGSYDVLSPDEKIPFSSGFSANAPESESSFARISTAELERLLGKGRFSVARSIEGLTRNVTVGRVGEEIFSLLLGVVIAVFCAEHFVANRFYESEQAAEHQ